MGEPNEGGLDEARREDDGRTEEKLTGVPQAA
jgi:hypothetical protein